MDFEYEVIGKAVQVSQGDKGDVLTVKGDYSTVVHLPPDTLTDKLKYCKVKITVKVIGPAEQTQLPLAD